MCQLPVGCEGEDVLADPALQSFLSRYRIARKIYDVNKIPELLIRELERMGMTDDPEMFRDLEIIYLEGSAKQRERESFRKQFKK